MELEKLLSRLEKLDTYLWYVTDTLDSVSDSLDFDSRGNYSGAIMLAFMTCNQAYELCHKLYMEALNTDDKKEGVDSVPG